MLHEKAGKRGTRNPGAEQRSISGGSKLIEQTLPEGIDVYSFYQLF